MEHANTKRVHRHTLWVKLIVINHIEHQICYINLFFLLLRNNLLFLAFLNFDLWLRIDFLPDLLFKLSDVHSSFEFKHVDWKVIVFCLDFLLVNLKHLLQIFLSVRHWIEQLFLKAVAFSILERYLLFFISFLNVSVLYRGFFDVTVLANILLLPRLISILYIFDIKWSSEQMRQTVHIQTVVESNFMTALQHEAVQCLTLSGEPFNILVWSAALIFVSKFAQS